MALAAPLWSGGWTRRKIGDSIGILLSTSTTMDRDDAKVRGRVPWFDPDMKLINYRAGPLGERSSPRRRPQGAGIPRDGAAGGVR